MPGVALGAQHLRHAGDGMHDVVVAGSAGVRQPSGDGQAAQDNVRDAAQVDRVGGLAVAVDDRVLAFYARFADEIAAREIAALPDDPDRAVQLERMVVGTVVYGQVLAILRRLAEEHHSAARFDRPVAPPGGPAR